MFEVLHEKDYSTNFLSPLTYKELKICGLAYVDNTDMLATSQNNDPVQTVEKMQDIIDSWEGVAKVTGGTIKVEKSWWYLINYNWSEDGIWTYETDNTSTQHLTATNATGEKKILKQIPIHQGQKMLGVHLTPNGSNKLQFDKMKEKVTLFAERVRTGHLHRHEAWLALNSMVMRSLEYPSSATTLTEKECKDIMWTVL